MATFDSLLDDGVIVRVKLKLPRGKTDVRELYAYPGCLSWMRTDVPLMVTGRLASAYTPAEQLIHRLLQWITGDEIVFDRMFKDMEPQKDGVWELKTADLRIFGWMYKPKKFIAVCGGYADHYKPPHKTKTYGTDKQAVMLARNSLPLDGGKFVMGEFNELV